MPSVPAIEALRAATRWPVINYGAVLKNEVDSV